MKRLRLLIPSVLVLAAAASAVERGGTLYVKARNTRVMKSTRPTADVVTVLQPGAPVVWLGPDAKEPRWQQVQAGGKKGFVFQSNLAVNPPRQELLSSQGSGKVSTKAFASSGAATKALGDGAVKYGDRLKATDAVRQVLGLEALAAQVPIAEAAAHARSAGLFPVVGATP